MLHRILLFFSERNLRRFVTNFRRGHKGYPHGEITTPICTHTQEWCFSRKRQKQIPYKQCFQKLWRGPVCFSVKTRDWNIEKSEAKQIMLQSASIGLALLLLWLNLHCATGEAVKPRSLGPAQPCSPDICKLPDCRCSGTDIPGNLPREKVPQMIMLTFDDAVNGQVSLAID